MDYPNGCTWRIIPLTVDLVRKWFSGLHLVNVSLHFVDYPISGWWFGTFLFFHIYIGNVIIPIDTIDFHIFFRGVGIPPTRFISNMMKQLYWWKWFWYIYYIQWLYPIYIYIMYKWVNKPHQFFFFFVGWSPRDISRYSRTMLQKSQVVGCNMEWAQWPGMICRLDMSMYLYIYI